MAGIPEISVAAARRLALLGQGLAGERLQDVMAVVSRLGAVQRDPTAVVAPTEELVIWSRLGSYSPDELRRLVYREQALVDYWVHIVAAADLPVHYASMRRYPRGVSARADYVRGWLRDNARFRRYVLGEIKRNGPLLSRDLEDRAEIPWQTGGWNDGKSLGRMLDALWFGGKLAIVGRRGRERVWDLAARHPAYRQPRVDGPEIARRLVERQLDCLGIARPHELGRGFDGPVRGAKSALRSVVHAGDAVEVTIAGHRDLWLASPRLLQCGFTPRCTLLSPFDNLIADRGRAERLFDFRFRLEVYRPPEQRRHGYFVMPLLHGDRFIARADIRRDQQAHRLHVGSIHSEPDVDPALAEESCHSAVSALTDWLFPAPR